MSVGEETLNADVVKAWALPTPRFFLLLPKVSSGIKALLDTEYNILSREDSVMMVVNHMWIVMVGRRGQAVLIFKSEGLYFDIKILNSSVRVCYYAAVLDSGHPY